MDQAALGGGSPTIRLVIVPVFISLVITLWRLTGELLSWSTFFLIRRRGGSERLSASPGWHRSSESISLYTSPKTAMVLRAGEGRSASPRSISSFSWPVVPFRRFSFKRISLGRWGSSGCSLH